MERAYNVIDSDGHILEPLTLWQNYLDPAYRERAPKLVIDTDGKERLLVEEHVLVDKIIRMVPSACQRFCGFWPRTKGTKR